MPRRWLASPRRSDTALRRAERRALRLRRRQENLARNYFSLDHPFESIYAAFPSDPFSRAALSTCRGLRILRQPQWECLATFITSPMKQVAHIRQISLELRARYGEQISGSLVNAFPTAPRLAQTTEGELRSAGSAFVQRAFSALRNAVASGEIDLDALAESRPPMRASSFASCLEWGAKWQTASCYLPTSDSMSFRWMSGLHGSSAPCTNAPLHFSNWRSFPIAGSAPTPVTFSNTCFITRG